MLLWTRHETKQTATTKIATTQNIIRTKKKKKKERKKGKKGKRKKEAQFHLHKTPGVVLAA